MSKHLVLLSGGLDSTVLLAHIHKKETLKNNKCTGNLYALNFIYGQKHKKESEYAEYQAHKYLAKYITLDISDIFSGMDNCMLKHNCDTEIPNKSYAEQQKENAGVVKTYIPYRNGIMLSIAAGIAYDLGIDYIYCAAHADDAAGNAYPDCTPEFLSNQNMAINRGTDNKVILQAPFASYNKNDIVSLGKKLKVDFSRTWSCYKGLLKPCGICGTCIDRNNALVNNGLESE